MNEIAPTNAPTLPTNAVPTLPTNAPTVPTNATTTLPQAEWFKNNILQVITDNQDTTTIEALVLLAKKVGKTDEEIADARAKATPVTGGWRGGENIGWSLGGELPAEMVGGYHRGKRHSKKAKRGGSLNFSLLGGRRRSGRKTGRKRR